MSGLSFFFFLERKEKKIKERSAEKRRAGSGADEPVASKFVFYFRGWRAPDENGGHMSPARRHDRRVILEKKTE